MGVAHVSCLARQAKILVEEAMENNLGGRGMEETWARWYACGLCEQGYHSVVRCALGWACWKTYLGRPETESCLRNAMTALSNGLYEVHDHQARLEVLEAELAIDRRRRTSRADMLQTKANLALCYNKLGRNEESLALRREICATSVALSIPIGVTVGRGINLAYSLSQTGRYEEAKVFLRELLAKARGAFGENDAMYVKLRWIYAKGLSDNPGASCDEIIEATKILGELLTSSQQVLGKSQPSTIGIERDLLKAVAQIKDSKVPFKELFPDERSQRSALEDSHAQPATRAAPLNYALIPISGT